MLGLSLSGYPIGLSKLKCQNATSLPPDSAVLPMFSALIIASISSFELRTLEFPAVASSLAHLLLPNTGHFLSLSALISIILVPVWVGTIAYMFLLLGSQPPVSPLCSLVHKLWEDLFMLCLQFWTNLNGILPVSQWIKASLNTDACHMICIPSQLLWRTKWSASPLFSGLHPSWC